MFQLTESAFAQRALALFRYQAAANPTYKRWLALRGVQPLTVNRLEDIPFLPIRFFKEHTVATGCWSAEAVFESSGTTGQIPSRHAVDNLAWYHKVCREGWERFYGPLAQYHFFALLPSYLERSNASLVSMAGHFISQANAVSGEALSGFYLNAQAEMLNRLTLVQKQGRTPVLLGVTFALLELAENHSPNLKGAIVMETGGMKGRRREMVRTELHQTLGHNFGLPIIHAEYGMTELLSQAYSVGNGLFTTPPWMRVILRDLNDPTYLDNNLRQGGINVIDLANAHSCAFIETQDIGVFRQPGKFEVLGRFDNSDVRGCNLMVAQ